MSYAQTLREHRRAAILRHLEQSGDYTSNAAILTDVLNGIGIATTRDQAIGELAWLQEQGLASLTDHGDFTIVTATQRGVETAQGVAIHPGVPRPRPGA